MATDPREVERLIERCEHDPSDAFGRLRVEAASAMRTLAAENAALREKLEAAEASRLLSEQQMGVEIDRLIREKREMQAPLVDLSAALQRVRDEAWNEAIEAAARRCYADQGRFDSPDRIRALRRAPTEDR